MKINKKNNAWHGYKGFKGTTLDQTESELYDDIPAEDQKTLMLKVLAGGQIAEERRRAAYYDTSSNTNTNPEDIEEIDAGTSAENFDYVTAYKQYAEQKKKYWQMAHNIKPANPEPEPKTQKEPDKTRTPEEPEEPKK